MTTPAAPPPPSALLLPHKKSVPIVDHTQYKWDQQHGHIKYCEIINYERAGLRGEHHCVMCGLIKGTQCDIPNQNKDVCKVCDCAYWRILDGNIIVKFCKGLALDYFLYFSSSPFLTPIVSLLLSLSSQAARNSRCCRSSRTSQRPLNAPNAVRGESTIYQTVSFLTAFVRGRQNYYSRKQTTESGGSKKKNSTKVVVAPPSSSPSCRR
jgi:hypothetical protein